MSYVTETTQSLLMDPTPTVDIYNETVCDDTPSMRTAFISVGTSLSAIGCVFNGILLYIFVYRTKKSYPFQTFLAFLDFMLCALYIHCFGFLAMAVEWKIQWMYDFVMDTNVASLVMSRIVQLAIPYTLIANSADKLAMIKGNDIESKKSVRLRLIVIGGLTMIVTMLRVNGFRTLEISIDTTCDEFHNKWLSQRQLSQFESEIWATYENILTFFHTFVSFVVLCALNIIVVLKLRVEHRKTRRQSTSPAQLFATSIARLQAAQEIREQQHRLRCAVKTTVVIISAYLACNCLNFVLYLMETFERNWILEENGSFKPFYVVISDLGSNFFVLSSTIRIFIYYKFNNDIKVHIKQTAIIGWLFRRRIAKKNGALLKTEKTDV